jgi:hypothetical protein
MADSTTVESRVGARSGLERVFGRALDVVVEE